MRFVAWSFAGLCLLPICAIILTALTSSDAGWASLVDTVLPLYIFNTVQLVLLVTIGTTIIGTGTAWLVTTCHFPGSRLFEFALAMPLAFPAYVMAYAYTDFLDHPGPVQTALRQLTGWGPRDYWFPEIRSLSGAATMLIFVLYPYVYLLARTAFLRQSATAYHAARTLGRGAWGAFFRISLPIARPAIAAGVLLALMETIADFGTVAHFNVPTFATGIFRAWFSIGNRGMATQLALYLLVAALVLVTLERWQRGQAQCFSTGQKYELIPLQVLSGLKAWGAMLFCAIPVIIGFIIPALVLIKMAFGSEQNFLTRRYFDFISNSVTLAASAALITVFAALLISYCVRIAPGLAASSAKLFAGIGYAIPGGVLAVGLLVPFANFDNWIDAQTRNLFGLSTGLIFTGSIGLLIIAYLVRFMAIAINSVDAGFTLLKPHLDDAARSLGKTEKAVLKTIHIPLLRSSLMTAFLIVFVDVMKELPATLIMRPFNFDTLAIQAYRLASDERLHQASVPSLIIVAIGLIPVFLICRAIAQKRKAERLITAP